MSMKDLFDFITDPTVNEKNIDEYLDKMSKMMENKSTDIDPEQQIEEEVFKNAYIPQRLTEVSSIIKIENSLILLYLLTKVIHSNHNLGD